MDQRESLHLNHSVLRPGWGGMTQRLWDNTTFLALRSCCGVLSGCLVGRKSCR